MGPSPTWLPIKTQILKKWWSEDYGLVERIPDALKQWNWKERHLWIEKNVDCLSSAGILLSYNILIYNIHIYNI